jgi:integrase
VLGLALDADESLITMKGSVVERWGKRRLSDITRTDVTHLVDEVAARAPYMANRLLAHLKSMFNFFIARDMIQVNPCIGVKPQPEEARDRILSDDELVRVWHAAGDLGWPHGPIVHMLVLTGQRRDEVSEMRWSEIDFDARLWKLPRERVKNNTAHEVPLSAPALDVLRRLPRKSKLVFLRPGLTQVSNFTGAKGRLDTISGVTDWRLHDLRRTVASGMARLGINLPVVEKVLNHTGGSFAGIVGVYQRHDFAGEKRDALDRWAAHVMGLVEGKPANVVDLVRAS